MIIREEYSFQDCIMNITQTVIDEIDIARTNAIVEHFQCDLSDFHQWLEQKQKIQKTNGDVIRTMDDEELAAMFYKWFVAFGVGRWTKDMILDWIREGAKNA